MMNFASEALYAVLQSLIPVTSASYIPGSRYSLFFFGEPDFMDEE